MRADLAIYGSHNAAAALAIDGKLELVLELERFINRKNIGIFMYYTPNSYEYVLEFISEYILEKYGIAKYDTVIVEYLNENQYKYFPADQYKGAFHHLTHAYNSFYQSDHDEALIFSFDAGGNDGYFNIFHGMKGASITKLEYVPQDLGFAYMIFGDRIDQIRREDLWYGNLIYPGKLMGLCAYGEVNEDWLPHFMEFYAASPEGPTYQGLLMELGEKIGVDFYPDRISGKIAEDVAATSQKAFEETFLKIAKPYLEQYPDLPVHMAGGCALNIILNTRLVEEFGREVFVAPNPNDCGLALGMLLEHLKPEEPVDATYSGLEVLDRHSLYEYVEKHTAYKVTLDEIALDLKLGKILGVVRGRSEHGPRALGNRSILCNPSIPGMKDILNNKVKHREPYRPFAPVVRLEDVNTYFEWEGESRWMTFCPKVREEWREKLAAIVHADGTARVQTVTLEQNPWLYRLLTEFAQQNGGVGVLLNTSFNTRGKPILTTYKDAIDVYTNEQMDRLLLGEFYFNKDKYFPQ